MNKFKKVMLSILGGVDVTFYMFTPIFLAIVWVSISGFGSWHNYFFYTIGLISTVFRAIKIGWLENGRRNGTN